MKYQKLIIFTVAFIFLFGVCAAQTHKITGTIRDSKTNEAISHCAITLIKVEKRPTILSDENGVFTIDVAVGDKLQFSHISYESKIITTIEKVTLNIFLTPKVSEISEVTVYSAYKPTNKGNVYTYTPLQAASSISIIGEPDVLRHLSSLPGVSQGVEGSLGLFVRGGNSGSNGIYFNDVPIYSSSHLIGLFSSFPADIIDQTSFYMGGMPTSYGNLSSSLLKISPKKVYGKSFNGKATLSPYMTGLYSKIPIIKDKLSAQIAGRTSFLPYIINQVSKNENEMKAQIFDLTFIVNYKPSEHHTFDLMFYSSNDYFAYVNNDTDNSQNWGTTVFKAGWDYNLSPKLNLKTTTYFNHTYAAQKQLNYDKNSSTQKVKSQLGLSSSLDEASANSSLKYNISENIAINAGLGYQKQSFTPTNQKQIVSSNNDINYTNKLPASLLSPFAELSYTRPNLFDLTLGYRHTFYNAEDYSCNNFDLHVVGHLYIKPALGVELTLDKLTQYYHVLEGLPTGWPLNILIPASKNQKEELSNQYYGGLFWRSNAGDVSWKTTLGGYYRNMSNIISYINGRNAFGLNNATWEDGIDVGRGSSYGIEFSGAIDSGRFGSTVAYTLSKTDRTFSKMNRGETYPFKFDRRHILNWQTKYCVIRRQKKNGVRTEQVVNGVLSLSSGNLATLPIGNYQGIAPPYWNQLQSGTRYPEEFYNNIYDRQQMSSKNGFIMKPYMRIDLSYTFNRYGKKSNSEFTISVFNVLNRQNPYTYFNEDGQWKQLSIMPIMPSVRWAITW